MAEDWRDGGFALYLHWPFCQAKCPYCDFNSHVVSQVDQAAWQTAYLAEIERVGRETEGRTLQSVFFGGGTPSLMDPSLIDAIITKIRATWPTANSIEITLEANPTSVEASRFAGYRDAGVNRVSLGLQALNDPDLRKLGRMHSADEGLAAVALARSHFERVSFDLIYARQDQTIDAWQAELETALSFAPDHLSLYQLTIEDGTVFGARHAAGQLKGLPSDDAAADMYFLTQDITAQAGLPSYEVSNHARSGQESVHNQVYWKSGDYVGIGPGAQGRLTLDGTRFGTSTPLSPYQWLKQVTETESGEDSRESITPQDHLTEFLLMGLRLQEGVSMSRLMDLGGDAYLNNINDLCNNGHLEHQDGHLRTTAEGRVLLNAVLRALLDDQSVPRQRPQ